MADRMDYRGHVLQRERMGHVNVFAADGGYVGGFPSVAAARTYVDAGLDRPIMERIPGTQTYRRVR
jgi:hypothetical protein